MYLMTLPRTPCFCSFASFSIVSLMHFINEPYSSRDLTIFIITSISLFEIIDAVIPDSKFFFLMTAPVADGVTVNPNDIKTLLGNGVSTFFINDNRARTNGPEHLEIVFLD